MPLTQTQIIQSLAEALSWFEKELEWGVSAGELGHLTGRIGELYAAMITRGQMALATNQRGYDVVSAKGERISVKTVTTSGAARFDANTLDLVDRAMVLRVNIDDDAGVSIETLLDIPREVFVSRLRHLANGMIDFPVRTLAKQPRPLDSQAIVAEAAFSHWLVRQYESGSMAVLRDGISVPVVKPVLREIAAKLGVDLRNSNDRPKNTRQLGAGVVEAIRSLT